MKTLYKKMILFLGLFIASAQVSSGYGYSAQDSYASLRYSKIFDQTDIYTKYKPLLRQLGCFENIFTSEQLEAVDACMDPIEQEKQLAQFEAECLAQVTNARFMTLVQPSIRKVAEMSVMLAVIAYCAINKKENNCDKCQKPSGDGLAGYFQASSVAWGLFDLINVGYNLISRPDNILADLEEHFAQNMCYIPKALWPKIISSFIAARQGGYGQESSVNFLKFVLNLTTYKPKVTLSFKDNKSIEDIKNELNVRIKKYFADYQECQTKDSLINLQLNLSKFIDELTDHENKTVSQGPRYIFLHGVGGIGKTHFVQTLASWIEELLPNSVRFEEMVINSSEELEGNEQKPGAFLKILRNQLMQNKRGSVVMLDEATWLNDGCMINSAKRVFNGDRSKLSTSYFGSNIDGTAVALNIPPMLIFVASNDAIRDDALASRFDVVHYPKPNKSALVHHALKSAQNSNALKNLKTVIDEAMINKWIEELSENDDNFRYVAGNVESFLLQQAYKQ